MSISGYAMKIIIAGPVMDVRKYYTARLAGTRLPRRKNTAPTSAQQALINEKNSIRKLEYLILANFTRDDIRLDLTFGGIEPSPEEAKKEVDKFLRKLRKLYRDKGHELKWIGVMEHDKHRVHQHFILNDIGLRRADYDALWPHAAINHKGFKPFDGGEQDAHRVAKYFVKETKHTYNKEGEVQKHRWRSSRNLVRPIEITKTIHAKAWRDDPKPKKGYYVARVDNEPDYNGNPHQYYRMIRDDNHEPAQTKGKRDVHHTSKPATAGRHRRRSGKHDTGQ